MMSNRLPMAVTELFLANLEKSDKVPAGTYAREISFADHPDNQLARIVKERETKTGAREEQVSLGLSPKDIDYKPSDGKHVMIAHPSALSPIIPESLREELEQGLNCEEECQADDEKSESGPEPAIPPLARSLSSLCTSSESREL